MLMDGVERTMKFCLEVEENVPVSEVTNFKEVRFASVTFILSHMASKIRL